MAQADGARTPLQIVRLGPLIRDARAPKKVKTRPGAPPAQEPAPDAPVAEIFNSESVRACLRARGRRQAGLGRDHMITAIIDATRASLPLSRPQATRGRNDTMSHFSRTQSALRRGPAGNPPPEKFFSPFVPGSFGPYLLPLRCTEQHSSVSFSFMTIAYILVRSQI